MTNELLNKLDIKVIGHVLAILQYAKNPYTGVKPASLSARSKCTAEPLQLGSNVTHPEFRKFKIDWYVYKTITNVPIQQILAQLYNICDGDVQNAIINTTRFLSDKRE